jgi:hypothetical protein
MHCELHQVRVRRDAQTITPTTIAAHELPILHALYGIENVEDSGLYGTYPVDEMQEYKRLVLKFGEDAVRAIYGEEHSGQLAHKLQHTAKSTVKSKASVPIASVAAE